MASVCQGLLSINNSTKLCHPSTKFPMNEADILSMDLPPLSPCSAVPMIPWRLHVSQAVFQLHGLPQQLNGASRAVMQELHSCLNKMRQNLAKLVVPRGVQPWTSSRPGGRLCGQPTERELWIAEGIGGTASATARIGTHQEAFYYML
jgi:hypothetical protein